MVLPTSNILRRSVLYAAALSPLLPAAAKPLQDYVLMVFSDPLPGMAAAYNDFYDHHHMPDVVSVPGFVRAQRFKLASPQLRSGGKPPANFVVFYHLATDYLAGVFAEVDYRLKSGISKLQPVMDIHSMAAHTFRALGPPIMHPGAQDNGSWREHFIQLVYSNPLPGMESAYNQWYDRVHAPQVVASPDFVAVRRYKRAEVQLAPSVSTQYLAVFDINSTDFAGTVRKFQARAPHLAMSRAFDGKSGGGYSYQAIGPVVEGDAIRAQHFARS